MNLVRRGLRRIVHEAGRRKLIRPLVTARLLHLITLGRLPDIKNPRDLNEKLLWIEYNTDTSRQSQLTDKYDVRKYVADKGLQDILIPMVGIYDDVEEIDFNTLPQKFVVKCTNGSARTIMVYDKDKLDQDSMRVTLNSWLKDSYGCISGEPHYDKIKPRVIIEEMIECGSNQCPVDYKFMCFGGKVHSCLVCTERNPLDLHCKFNLMEVENWTEIPDSTTIAHRGDAVKIEKPGQLEKMVAVAERLSTGFPFVRVDLYESGGKIYFGELTFTPAAFRIDYLTRSMLQKMGEML